MVEYLHQPVLLEEVLQALAVKPGGIYVDGTYGRGGHAAAVMQRLGPSGRLLAFDRDPAAVEDARARFAGELRFEIVRGPFSLLEREIDRHGWRGKVDGILLDLGVSSPQLDDASRGFSFSRPGPLDMRMDPEAGESAAEWLAHADEAEIARVLREYGEERFARRVARAICRAREEAPVTDTARLADIVAGAVPTREPGKHPATRTFQAIRIRVNTELEELDHALQQAVDVLAPGGRLCVISFHSLEDRRAKRFLRDASRVDPALARLPVVPAGAQPRMRLIGGAVRAGEDELRANPRARSATLRVAERLA
jgi:16S rRNA (cytosine1402-N4)-methyltransferase